MITKNNIILKNGSKVFENTATFSLVSEYNYFPRALTSTTNGGAVIFTFSEPSELLVNWGDGSSETLESVVRGGENIIDISRRWSGVSNGSVSNGKNYGSSGLRKIVFYFNPVKLIGLVISYMMLPKQPLVLPLYKYVNLKTLKISELKLSASTNPFANASLTNIDFRYVDNSNIDDFTVISSANDSEAISEVIPPLLFNLPLKSLSISLLDNTLSFNDSNLNRIGEDLADTLESLFIVSQLTNNKGIGETPIDPLYPNTGGLPGNFLKLVNLKVLRFNRYRQYLNWTAIPTVISQMTWLEELTFHYSWRGSSFSIPTDFFTNMTSLTLLDLSHISNYITNFNFIDNISPTIKYLGFQNVGNATYLDIIITKIFNWTVANALTDNVINLSLGTTAPDGAATPSGTYQEPLDHDNPATPLEMIWVMVNDYNCTVTYEG